MKQKYSGYEAKKSGGFVELPPEGAYIAQILEVNVEKSYDKVHDQISLLIDITEGEYAGRYLEQYNDVKERFPDAKCKGVFRILVPEEDDPADKMWIRNKFESSLWAIEQSNEGYAWDWDEKKLKNKKVGITVGKRYYTYNGKDRETTEIGRLESIKEVREGKTKPVKPRDNRTASTDDTASESGGATDVTGTVDVPF